MMRHYMGYSMPRINAALLGEELRVRKAFGKVVRHWRKHRKISQEDLAADAGMDRSYLGCLERGGYTPTIFTVIRLCQVLGIRSHTMMRNVEDVLAGGNIIKPDAP
jgi:DNA-binding XRE family transcriptional regulator